MTKCQMGPRGWFYIYIYIYIYINYPVSVQGQ